MDIVEVWSSEEGQVERQKERVEVMSCERCAEKDDDHAQDGRRKDEGEDEGEKSWLEIAGQPIPRLRVVMRLTISLAPISCSDFTAFLFWPGLCACDVGLWPLDGRHTTQ